jgi:hypothetical protein
MMRARYTPPGGSPEAIPFTYESQDADRSSGVMVATLGRGGAHLRGPYTRVEASTQGQLVTEVWDGFGAPEWNTWTHDAQGNWVATGAAFGEFAHFYTGKVVAYLKSPDGPKMRCQIELNEPAEGLLGGGSGSCQVSNGGRVELSW